jgi:1-acyl-sn-glycerol-3-phosphate acyltransferase
MPQAPLSNPSGWKERFSGTVKAVPAVGFLFVTLIAFNLAQTLSLLLLPFSRRAFRRFNRWAADLWWGWCVSLAKCLHKTRIELSGDPVPDGENALVLSNHQQMPDITFLMFFARSKRRLGDMKWFVKDIIKYVPGAGWGMLFLDCPFVKRDWAADRESIARTFSRLVRGRVPVWLILFPEGTRITPQKLKSSHEFARTRGLRAHKHLLLPRTKGFAASVQGLRSHLDAVYDITIGYPTGVPTLWQYCRGFVRVAHLYVRRFPIDAMPAQDGELSKWLIDRFLKKDQLLDRFYQTGCFTSAARGR